MKELKDKILNRLEDLEYYDVVDERREEIDFEKIVDIVFKTVAEELDIFIREE